MVKKLSQLNQNSLQLQQWLIILLIAILFLLTYNRSWINTQKSPPYLMNYAQAASISISELIYGSDQGVGYLKIYDLFTPLFRGADWGPEFSMVNTAIEKALSLKNVSSEGTHSTNYERLDAYYKVAFLLFGYKAESAFYLFWFLLAGSVLIFLVTFYKQPILLFYLLLFMCALFAISQTQGVLLESIIRNRFFPILTVLPSFYLALIIFGYYKWNWLSFIGVVGQALILAIIIYVRPSSLYQILFLIGATLMLMMVVRQKRKTSGQSLSFAIQFWPLIVVLIVNILVRGYTFNLASHNSVTNRNCSWHIYYMGLAAHPEAFEKYGIIRDDAVVFRVVEQRAPELGYSYNHSNLLRTLIIGLPANPENNEIATCGAIYETIVKDEFLKIFRQDWWFVVSSYFYRFFLYFQVYFSPLDQDIINTVRANPANPGIDLNYKAFGIINQLSNWPVVIALILGIFLVQKNFLMEWITPLLLFVLQFGCALLIPLLYFPINHTIADSALSLTVVLMALFSGAVCYGLRFISRRQTNTNLLYLGFISLIVLLPVLIFRNLWGYAPFEPGAKPLTQETQFYGQPLDQLFPEYDGFNIILYKDKYYALAQLGQVDLTDESELGQCQLQNQCFVGNSLEGVKIQVSPPKIIVKNIKGFDIVEYDHKFYLLSYALGKLYQDIDPAMLIDEQFLQACEDHGQCAIGNSLEEAKQLVDLMPKLVLEDYQGFDVVSYYYKFYVLSRVTGILEQGLDPAGFTDERFLQECQAHSQCATGNSLEEAKQLVDLLIPQ